MAQTYEQLAEQNDLTTQVVGLAPGQVPSLDQVLRIKAREAALSRYLELRVPNQTYVDFLLSNGNGPEFNNLNGYESRLKRAIEAHQSSYPNDVITGARSNGDEFPEPVLDFVPLFSAYGQPDRDEACGTIADYIEYKNIPQATVDLAKVNAFKLQWWDWRQYFLPDALDYFGRRGPGGEKEYRYFLYYSKTFSQGGPPASDAYAHLGYSPSNIGLMLKAHFACMHFRNTPGANGSYVDEFYADPRNKDTFPDWLGIFIVVAVGIGAVAAAGGFAAAGSGTVDAAASGAAGGGSVISGAAAPIVASAPVDAVAAGGTAAAAAGSGGILGLGTVGTGIAGAVGTTVVTTLGKDLGNLLSPAKPAPTAPAPKPTLTAIPGGKPAAPSALGPIAALIAFFFL